MTASNPNKMLKQIGHKPGKLAKFKKHNLPKKRSCGKARFRCERCGRYGGVIHKYGLNLCRHCVREVYKEIGFIQYS